MSNTSYGKCFHSICICVLGLQELAGRASACEGCPGQALCQQQGEQVKRRKKDVRRLYINQSLLSNLIPAKDLG